MTFRRALVPVCLALVCGACASGSGGAVPRPFPGASTPPPSAPQPQVTDSPVAGDSVRSDVEASTPEPTRAQLVATALGLRGTPYRNGGSDPSGFDCSGFVQYVFAKYATPLPREAWDQFHVGLAIRLDEIQPGDLLFFETVSKGASHVAVAIGGERFVHAPSSRGVVRVESFTTTYWSERFIGARRVIN